MLSLCTGKLGGVTQANASTLELTVAPLDAAGKTAAAAAPLKADELQLIG